MKTSYKYIWITLACFIVVWSCSKKPTDYRSFLDGQELIYPGKANNPAVIPGNLRIMLTWSPSPDPSIVKYVVYWNNYADSVVVNASTHASTDTIKTIISNLSEYTYSFFIYSYDNAGNRSVLTELDNARVYGPIYQGALFNRSPDQTNLATVRADSSVTLNFLTPDTININTSIQYVNRVGGTVKRSLSPDSSSITLNDYNYTSPIVYQSSYIPVRGALDTFYTVKADSFPTFNTEVMCNKSLFNTINGPNDLQALESDTYLAQLWNGDLTVRGYPNIWHSSGSPGIPGTITFDLGKVYQNLERIEETGRNCCHNPLDFEIWGISDTTGAFTSLLPGDGGWKADMQAKGWTELKEVVRGDDGTSPFDATFITNPPPVRYIIMRILTTDGSGYANMSQLTFWYKL